MQLLWCCSLLLLFSTSYAVENTSLVTGLVVNPFPSSVIIALPTSCQYSQKTATLTITQTNNTGTIKTVSFTTPQCRPKRDLIIVNDTQTGNLLTTNVGYQANGLLSNTEYTAYYVIGSETFGSVNFNTPNVGALPVTFARSGGMIVITVILSISMLLLLGGLIAVFVFGEAGKK